MIKKRRVPRIFFGWWAVIGSSILALWTGGYYAFGFSVFFKPVASELGFSRAVASTVHSIGQLGGGVGSLPAGWVTDKFGPRVVFFLAVFLFGLGLILLNFINSLWAFLIVWGGMLGTMQITIVGVPLDTTIANWFVKKRGLAQGIKSVIFALGGTLVVPLVTWLIINLGWRKTCLIGGVALLLVGLPLAWFCFKRHRPEYYGLLPDGATVEEGAAESSQMIDRGVKYAAEVEEVEFTLKQAMRTPAFWVLIVSSAVHGMAMPAITLHGIPFLTDMGIAPLAAAGILSIWLFVSIPTRFVGGFFADRVSKHHLRFMVVGGYFIQALGLTLFLLNQTIPMIYVWFVLFGVGRGGEPPLAVMKARYFGRKAFGSIQGTIMMFITPVGIIAPIYFGWVYDTTGSYISAFTIVAVLLAIATVLAAFILPPKSPAQITDTHKIA